MKPRGAPVVFACALGAAIASRSARADTEPLDPDLVARDANTLGGYGTKLNFRGVSEEFNVDATVSVGPHRDAVEALRASARLLVLPELLHSVGWWGIWAGVRAGGFRFERSADPADSPPGGVALANIEPTFGLVVTNPGDRLRLEVDLAPAISAARSSRISSQAALVAALSTAPHDDLLFVPNLASAGRLRIAMTRRWDFGAHAALAVGLEIEIGHARTQTAFGASEGETGGGDLAISFYLRHVLPFVEGIIIQPTGDIGYTSVWPSDVVLPMRLGGTFAIAVNRTLELRAAVASFSSSPVMGGPFFATFDSWATTVGVRGSFDRSPATWTKRHLDLEPDIQNAEAK